MDIITEVLESLLKLQDKAQRISKNSKYPEDDLRRKAFLHVLGVVQPSIVIWNVIRSVKQNQIPDYIYMPLFGMEKGWASFQFVILGGFTGISIITQFHFGVEVFLKNILAKMQKNDIPKKFNQISKQVLENISVNDKEKKLQILMALAHIRNGYHSNGIHINRTTEPFKIDNLEYQFVQGKAIECGTPKHVFALIDAIVSIMEEIVNAKEIENIKEKIPDVYLPSSLM